MNEKVIVYTDKVMLKISGLQVKGIKPGDLEDEIGRLFNKPVRTIGVTGDTVELDIYNLDAEQVLTQAEGIVKAVSLTEGITPGEVVRIASSEKVIQVGKKKVEEILSANDDVCGKARWMNC